MKEGRKRGPSTAGGETYKFPRSPKALKKKSIGLVREKKKALFNQAERTQIKLGTTKKVRHRDGINMVK